MMTQLFKSILVGLTFLFLASCGQPVCVIGIGQCNAPEKPTSASGGSLTVTADATTIYAVSNSTNSTHSATITISGGTPNYSISIVPSNTNAAYFLNGTAHSNFISGVSSPVVLNAENSFGSDANLILNVFDSASPQNSGTLSITVRH
jgi:hypothetical protein